MPEQDPRHRVHYVHRLSYSFRERLVGVFVLGALVVIFGLIIVNSRTAHLFESRITYHAYLRNAEGISTETIVKASGIEVGRVSNVDIAGDNRIHVTLHVFGRFHDLVREDSSASIGKLSVLGQSTIKITPGSIDLPLLPDGASIPVEEPLSLDELMAEVTPLVKKIGQALERITDIIAAVDPQRVEGAVVALSGTAENLRVASARVASGEGALGATIYSEEFKRDFWGSWTAAQRAFSTAEQRLDEIEGMTAEMNSIARNTEQASRGLPELVGRLNGIAEQMNTTMSTLNVELQQFPDLFTRMNVLMERTERMLEGVQQSWIFSSGEQGEPARLVPVDPR